MQVTIAKGYYLEVLVKRAVYRDFSAGSLPWIFFQNRQNPWSDWKNFSNTRRMRRIFSAHVQIFRGDLDLYEGYLFPTELLILLQLY